VQCSSIFVEPMKWMQTSEKLWQKHFTLYRNFLYVSHNKNLCSFFFMIFYIIWLLQYMMEWWKRSFYVLDVTGD
jgi:hypothetical protein